MPSTSKLPASTKIALAVALLAGCENVDIFLSAAGDEGTVYECELTSGAIVEYCYLDDANEELADRLGGGTCGTPTRRWPRFTNFLSVGCAYTCPGKRGCNAHQGCYCP